jgi:hypothetical protein
MQVIVVRNTERHSELVTDLLRQSARLGKGDVVGVTGKLLANDTGLGGDKLQMGLAAQAPFAWQQERTLVDREAAGNLRASQLYRRRICGGYRRRVTADAPRIRIGPFGTFGRHAF